MPETTAYSCPQCKATLKLDPTSGKLTCEYCGGAFTVEEIEARVEQVSTARQKAEAAEKAEQRRKKGEAEAATATAAANGKPKHKQDRKKGDTPLYAVPEGLASYSIEEWETRIAEGKAEQFDEMVGYVCTNCGAQVVTDKLTVATSCQYCGSSVVVDERLTGGLKPNYVIPFKIKAEEVARSLTIFYEKRPLLPKRFFYENQVGEVQGIYVPFWLYDGVVDGEASYKSTRTSSYYSAGDDVTETWTYQSDRKGYVQFSNVPVDASERIDNDLMDSIEPFDYSKMVPFKPGYLTGFVAERFDRSPREEFDRSGKRMMATAKNLFDSSVLGTPITQSKHFEFTHASASYVFLPVYLFNCKYMGKHYRYAVNGQTGKVVGEVPIGKKESMMAFLKAALKGGGAALIIALILLILAL